MWAPAGAEPRPYLKDGPQKEQGGGLGQMGMGFRKGGGKGFGGGGFERPGGKGGGAYWLDDTRAWAGPGLSSWDGGGGSSGWRMFGLFDNKGGVVYARAGRHGRRRFQKGWKRADVAELG